MTHDELLAGIDSNMSYCGHDCESCKSDNAPWIALRAVVQLIKEKQDWLDLTSGDTPMTNEQLYRREERWSLLAEFKAAIEKELT